MEETIFPPSPSWFLPNIIATREDGSVTYGAKNNIVILKSIENKNSPVQIISNAHKLRITAVAFSPSSCHESVQNTIASCSDDGFVKLWNINEGSAATGHKSHWEQTAEIGKVITLDWCIANPHLIISAAENNTLVVWNVLSNTTVKFSFQKLGATVIACCPYNEKIVAIGSKAGQIYIIHLTGGGDILYRLRGHDNKIHSLTWCPVPCNVFNDQNFYEECLLASACQDREVYVWRSGTDGKCEIKFQLPTSSLTKKDGVYWKLGNSFSFSALCWAEPYKIYSSSNFGELFYFDIKSYITDKHLKNNSIRNKQFHHFKLAHNCHNKGLFAIACWQNRGEVVLLKNVVMKSVLKFKIETNNSIIKKNAESELNDNVEWKVVTSAKSSLLWTAGQDRQLIACEISSGKFEIIRNYHTMNGFVYCAVVSPHDPNKIAVGVGDGMIRLWNLTEPSGNVQVYWQKIKDRVMSLSWHPTRDGFLAFGTSEGRMGLIDTNSNKPPILFKPSHPHSVYSLSWGPAYRTENSSSEFGLYSVGDNILSFCDPLNISAEPLNLSQLIPFSCRRQTDICWKPDYFLMAVGCEDGSICLVEPNEFKIVHTVLVYKKLIESIAWHPSSTSVDTGLSPYHGYFTSGSTDNDCEIRVFNCIQEDNAVKVEKVATLKGHNGHVKSVSWSPHVSAHLVSTSSDCSVQIWDVIAQSPLVNFTPTGMPIFSIWSPVDSDFVLTGCKNDVLCIWRVSAQTSVAPPENSKSKKQKKDKGIVISSTKESSQGIEIVEIIHKKGLDNLAVVEPKAASRSGKELKMFSKVWLGEITDELKHCYTLLKNKGSENNSCNYSFGFLQSEDSFNEIIKAEEETYKKSNNCTEYYELSLWTGNLRKVLDEKIKSGQLNDFLVSLAPTVSPRLWQEACLAYSKSLAEKKFYRKAASYLLVCNKIYEAIRLLVDAKLYLEALCIARSRFPESDPIRNDIIREYAEWLFSNGSYLKACECYIFLEDYLEVAKICGKKSQAEYLSLAALAARKCGSSDLEQFESVNAIIKCFETNNFELACRICEDHDNLKYLSVIFKVYQTIHLLDSGDLHLETDILSLLKQTCELSDVTFPSSMQQLYHKYCFYKNRKQVLVVIAQELSFALCCSNAEDIIVHLIKALSTSYRYLPNSADEIHLLCKLCNWLLPRGLFCDSFFTLKDDSLKSKVKSLRAFLGAAIVRKLGDHPSVEGVMENLDLLEEVKDDVLDEGGYRYFKNLIEVEVLEKKLSKNCLKIKNKSFSENNTFNSTNDSGTEYLGTLDNHLETEAFTEMSQDIFEKKTENEKDTVEEGKIVDGEISKDLEILQRLKMEIKIFESTRISCPNPIPIYFMIKKFCETLPDNTAKSFLENLHKKWHLMN